MTSARKKHVNSTTAQSGNAKRLAINHATVAATAAINARMLAGPNVISLSSPQSVGETDEGQEQYDDYDDSCKRAHLDNLPMR